jgi:hypothetical protein
MSARIYAREQASALRILFIGGALGFFVIAAIPAMAPSARLLAFAVGICFGGFYLTRLRRVAVYTASDGVRVVNPFSAVDLAWDQIERFRVGRHGLYPRIGLAQLVDGETVRLWAIQGPSSAVRPRNHEAETCIEELNRILEESKM